MFKDLMTSRRFAPLFWCQFCSALNDNFLKNALVMLILFGLGGAGGVAGGHGPMLVTLAGIVFIAPFFILSALGGEIADRFDKAYVAARIKLAEIPIAALAAIGFYLHSVPILFVTLALFGMVAALFGPVKYGILPEKLQTAELPAGNALVEGATFLAILIGTIAGGIAVAEAKSPEIVVAVILALAVVSWTFARTIPAAGPAAPNLVITRNPWTSTFALLREIKGDQRLWGGAHIVSWFWVVGSVALSLLPAMVKDHIGGTEGVVTLGPHHLRDRHRDRLGAGGACEPRQTEPGPGAAGRRPDGNFCAHPRRAGRHDVARTRAGRSGCGALIGRRAWRWSLPCAASPLPAGSSSCRRSRPCRPGRRRSGARA